MKHSKILALLLVVMMVFGCASALADYPEKAIEVLIPASPGGDTDTTVRAIAQSLTEILGQPVVVTNMPGGAGTVAMNELLSSTALSGRETHSLSGMPSSRRRKALLLAKPRPISFTMTAVSAFPNLGTQAETGRTPPASSNSRGSTFPSCREMMYWSRMTCDSSEVKTGVPNGKLEETADVSSLPSDRKQSSGTDRSA